MSSYANPEALVSTAWLEQHLEEPDVVVVEVDEDTGLYADPGHIPGAVLWDWNADLHHPVQRDYLDQAALSELLARSGIGKDQVVVLYGGNSNWFAAYAYWLLALRGFGAVRLLDGGRKKWELERRPLTRESSDPARPSDPVTLGSTRDDLRAKRDYVLGSLGSTRFVDVRSPGEFDGSVLAPPHLPQEQPYAGGHIPGAFNIPWSKAVKEDGSFLPPDALEALYRPVLEASNGSDVVAYCRIGERAAHTWFALHELLGVKRAKNYDGSWTEYGSLVGVPVETGAQGGDR